MATLTMQQINTIRRKSRNRKSINLTEEEMAAGVKGVKPKHTEGDILADKNRRYRRISHTARERIELARQGFIPVQSSNVSAVSRDEKHLYIRYHNGSVYKYYDQGDKMSSLLKSNSKGKWVWRNLRRKKNIRFEIIGNLPLKRDWEVEDETLFEGLDKRKVSGRLFELTKDYFKRKNTIKQTPLTRKELNKVIKEDNKIKLTKKGKELKYKGEVITERLFKIIVLRAEVLRRKEKTRKETKELRGIEKLIKKLS